MAAPSHVQPVVPASGAGDLHVRLWDLEKVQQRHAVSVGRVWGVGFQPDAKRVYHFGASYGALGFIDVDSGKPSTPAYSSQHSGAVQSADVTRDGRYAVTAGHSDGTVRMWRLNDGKEVRQDLRFRHAGRQIFQHVLHGDARASHAGLAAADPWCHRDQLFPAHRGEHKRLTVSRQAKRLADSYVAVNNQ